MNNLNMYNKDGKLNNNYMKGKMIKNYSTVSNENIGIVKGFYQASSDNKTHANLRFYTVAVKDSKGKTKNVNWWYDTKDGKYNTNVRIITHEELLDEYAEQLSMQI